MKSLVDFVLGRMKAERSEDPFLRDEIWIKKWRPLIQQILRWFRPTFSGAENLPADGPMLLVANHSGGLYTPEAYVMMEWWARNRLSQPLYVLAHDFLFSVPLFNDVLRRAGGIPASVHNAEAALQSGASLLVFPGGDFEAFRPWWQRDRVEFSGRMGFVRLALRNNVPIVPVVAHGSHDTTFVVSRGERLASLLKLDRVRSRIMPFVIGVPWGLVPGFIPVVPLPAQIAVRFLPALNLAYGVEAATDRAAVRKCYEDVVELMQAALQQMVREHPFPLSLSSLR